MSETSLGPARPKPLDKARLAPPALRPEVPAGTKGWGAKGATGRGVEGGRRRAATRTDGRRARKGLAGR